jgi:hypothetical protein
VEKIKFAEEKGRAAVWLAAAQLLVYPWLPKPAVLFRHALREEHGYLRVNDAPVLPPHRLRVFEIGASIGPVIPPGL